jgi:hypothetical protein
MADNIATTQADLISRLLANLPSGYTNATVKKPNFKFTTPKNTKWLRATVSPFDTESEASSGDYKITRGLFVVDVFYPKGSGDAAQLTDVQAIRALYERQTFGNTQCQMASVETIGDSELWYIMQVNIEWYMAGF